MRSDTAFERIDPVDMSEVERVCLDPVFEELVLEIMARPPLAHESVDHEVTELRLPRHSRQLRPSCRRRRRSCRRSCRRTPRLRRWRNTAKDIG